MTMITATDTITTAACAEIEHIVRPSGPAGAGEGRTRWRSTTLIAQAESHGPRLPGGATSTSTRWGPWTRWPTSLAVCYAAGPAWRPSGWWSRPSMWAAAQVRCAHGILPVPAPATAHILHGRAHLRRRGPGGAVHPHRGGAAEALCHRASAPCPVMRWQAVGYGMGTKDFEAGQLRPGPAGRDQRGAGRPFRSLLCNIDDMTGRSPGLCHGQAVRRAGALEVIHRCPPA